jgi:sporulation integral membrane protein YlbJ
MTAHAKNRFITIITGLSAVCVVMGMVTFPAKAFDASLHGLTVWWNMVFPALLPFFILCEIVIAYGLTHALGAFIDPITWRVLSVSGFAGLPLVTGALAGSPAGAQAVVKLYQQNLISQSEAEHLTKITHFANPVFIYSIVAFAFLQKPELAPYLMVIHYLSAFLYGLFIRVKHKPSPITEGGYLNRIFTSLEEAQQSDQRSFGKILGDAVYDSLQKLMMIGGIIIIFSVLLELITISGIQGAWQTTIIGITEVHLGTFAFSQWNDTSLVWTLAIISGLLGWGGIAVHIQVHALLQGTPIRYMPFLLGRICHAGIAVTLTWVLWLPYQRFFGLITPTFHHTPALEWEVDIPFSLWHYYLPWQHPYVSVAILLLLLLAYKKRTY